MESFSDRHLRDNSTLVGTDEACTWDKPRKESAPILLEELKLGTKEARPAESKIKPCKLYPLNLQQVRDRLSDICQNTGCISPFLKQTPIEQQPKPLSMYDITDLYLSQTSTTGTFKDFMQTVITPEMCLDIEKETRGQSSNNNWFTHRLGRITASTAHKVLHFRDTGNLNNYISNQIMTRKHFTSKFTDYGIQFEPVAKQFYKDYAQKTHTNVVFQESGLVVDCKYPFLGASPDLIVNCKCCNVGVIEIKCPYSKMNALPTELPYVLNDHFCISNGKVTLKHSSSWFVQIQMQMGLKQCLYGDLVIYTQVSPFIGVYRIEFDEVFFHDLILKLTSFFHRYILPLLISKSSAKEG